MNDMGFIFFIIFIGSIAIMVNVHKKRMVQEEKRANEIKEFFNEALANLENFYPSQKYVSPDLLHLIAISEETEEVAIIEHKFDVKNNQSDFDLYVLDFEEVMEIGIVEDESSITSTSRGSQLGGAIVGGLLAGGVGAIIGGLSASSTTNTKVKKIQLKIVVDDFDNPVYFINFLNEVYPISKNDEKYINAMEQVNRWYGIMSIVIKRADEKAKIRNK